MCYNESGRDVGFDEYKFGFFFQNRKKDITNFVKVMIHVNNIKYRIEMAAIIKISKLFHFYKIIPK